MVIAIYVKFNNRFELFGMLKKFKQTNIFIIDSDLWAWAAYKAKILGYDSVSNYIFDLIKLDKDRELLKKS